MFRIVCALAYAGGMIPGIVTLVARDFSSVRATFATAPRLPQSGGTLQASSV